MRKEKLIDLREIARKCGCSIQDVEQIIQAAKESVNPITMAVTVKENGARNNLTVARQGVGILNTDFGKFWEYKFHLSDQWEDYSVIFRGDVDDKLNPVLKDNTCILLRTDSGCQTGQVFGDKTCECLDQLHLAMKALESKGEGFIIHIPNQDGRGMGIPFKLATLYLQDALGLDTVESATVMSDGEEFDIRTYSGVVAILKFFGIETHTTIDLATNNPRKASVFGENGYRLNSLKPVKAPITERLSRHLLAKQEYLGHLNLL